MDPSLGRYGVGGELNVGGPVGHLPVLVGGDLFGFDVGLVNTCLGSRFLIDTVITGGLAFQKLDLEDLYFC